MVIKRLPTEPVYAKTVDALDESGYVMRLNPDGTVAKATSADIPFGVALTSTVNPITNTPEANVEVAIVPIKAGFIAKVKKESGAVINVGDYVEVSGTTPGTVVAASNPPVVDTTTGDASALVAWMRKIVGRVLEVYPDHVVVQLSGF